MFCECALNIINGNIAMNVNKLMPFEQQLKILCQLQTSDRRLRQVSSSIKGYKLFKLISCLAFAFYHQNECSSLYSNTKRKLHQESTKSVLKSGQSYNYGKRSTTCFSATSSRKKDPKKENLSRNVKAPQTRENIQKRVLRSITMFDPHQTKKSISTF